MWTGNTANFYRKTTTFPVPVLLVQAGFAVYLIRRADGQPRVDVGIRDGIAGRRTVTVEQGENEAESNYRRCLKRTRATFEFVLTPSISFRPRPRPTPIPRPIYREGEMFSNIDE